MLSNLVRATRVIQTLENYALTENSIAESGDSNDVASILENINSEADFWRIVMNPSGSCWDSKFIFREYVFNEWVPRVPGLYWSNNNKSIRSLPQSEVPIKKEGWVEFSPPEKSAHVIGGIGSVLLPPNESDMVLCSVSSFGNASTGIPILISRELIVHHKLRTGSIIDLKATWKRMPTDWAIRFESMRGIPKGALSLESASQIVVKPGLGYVQFHPYSIMEYESRGALLWDFVYLTGERIDDRGRFEDFFEYYRTKDGRNGKFLISSDISQPLFDSEYNSPSDLKSPYGKAQLRLLEKRIRKDSFRSNSLDDLVRAVSKSYSDANSLRSFATRLGVENSFLSGESSATLAPQLVDRYLQENRIEELIDRICLENPNMFT